MISVIGAGPVGCYLGFLLAKKGYDVQIFEEHSTIGRPVQCTGLLTSEISNFVSLGRESIINRVDTVRIFAPDNSSADIKLGKEEIVVDRQRFDQHLAEKAVDAGARLCLSHRLKGVKGKNIVVNNRQAGKSLRLRPDFIVGADGVRSIVARAAGLERQAVTGMQARVRLECIPNIYEVHFGSNFPGFFGWVVPESDSIARIGLAAGNNAESHFSRFLSEKLGAGWRKKVIGFQGGLIPVYNPNARASSGNIFLVGDAAGQIKNTTAGGIVPGLAAAEALCDSIAGGRDYEAEWRRRIGRSLWLHYRLRKLLDNFSDRDYNRLIALCKRPGVRGAIESESREFPARLLMKLILSEPRLLGFGRHLLKLDI